MARPWNITTQSSSEATVYLSDAQFKLTLNHVNAHIGLESDITYGELHTTWKVGLGEIGFAFEGSPIAREILSSPGAEQDLYLDILTVLFSEKNGENLLHLSKWDDRLYDLCIRDSKCYPPQSQKNRNIDAPNKIRLGITEDAKVFVRTCHVSAFGTVKNEVILIDQPASTLSLQKTCKSTVGFGWEDLYGHEFARKICSELAEHINELLRLANPDLFTVYRNLAVEQWLSQPRTLMW